MKNKVNLLILYLTLTLSIFIFLSSNVYFAWGQKNERPAKIKTDKDKYIETPAAKFKCFGEEGCEWCIVLHDSGVKQRIKFSEVVSTKILSRCVKEKDNCVIIVKTISGREYKGRIETCSTIRILLADQDLINNLGTFFWLNDQDKDFFPWVKEENSNIYLYIPLIHLKSIEFSTPQPKKEEKFSYLGPARVITVKDKCIDTPGIRFTYAIGGEAPDEFAVLSSSKIKNKIVFSDLVSIQILGPIKKEEHDWHDGHENRVKVIVKTISGREYKGFGINYPEIKILLSDHNIINNLESVFRVDDQYKNLINKSFSLAGCGQFFPEVAEINGEVSLYIPLIQLKSIEFSK